MASETVPQCPPELHFGGQNDKCMLFTPEDDSPRVLMIGSLVSDERLERVALKYGLDPEAVRAFVKGASHA